MYSSVFRGCLQNQTILNISIKKIFTLNINTVLLNSKRFSSKNCNNNNELGCNTILIQDGTNVQELPLIIRKVKNILAPEDRCDVAPSYNTKCDSDVIRLIRKEFLKCSTYREVIALISKCSEITPNIAVGAVERIFSLCNDTGFHEHLSRGIPSANGPDKDGILDSLIRVIISSDNVWCLMNGIKLIPSGEPCRNHLTEELLDRVTDRRLTVKQLCHAVRLFSDNKKCPNSAENTEKLWLGFIDREKDFSKDDLVSSIEILPLLSRSRGMVLGVVERAAASLLPLLEPQDVVRILESLYHTSVASGKTVTVLATWLNTNILGLSPELIIEIITKFTQIDYTNSDVDKALEKYMKTEGVKITSRALVVTVLNHCSHFRIRNPHILNGCAEYFIVHGRNLPPMFLRPTCFPFGWLNFNPSNRIKFWEELETNFLRKFSKMNTEDVLDTMLACIYLRKYPLNLVDKVFNPNFLERVNRAPNYGVLRNKLKLIDTAMSLECRAYGGPLLPRDARAHSLRQDARVRRLLLQLRAPLERLAGGAARVSTGVLLPRAPCSELYVLDALLHPAGLRASILGLAMAEDRGVASAVLVHVPEHYCSDGRTLVGPQAMRETHIRLMGLKVISLHYDTLCKLRIHGTKLNDYLVDRIKNAAPPLSGNTDTS